MHENEKENNSLVYHLNFVKEKKRKEKKPINFAIPQRFVHQLELYQIFFIIK